MDKRGTAERPPQRLSACEICWIFGELEYPLGTLDPIGAHFQGR